MKIEIEKTQKQLRELKSKKRKENWNRKINWYNKHKQRLAFGLIFLMLGFIIFNQITYIDKDQYFYIGEIKDIGIRWEDTGPMDAGSHKVAIVWISFNDSTTIDFQKYNYDVYEKIELSNDNYIGKKVIVTYEKSVIENTLLSIMMM